MTRTHGMVIAGSLPVFLVLVGTWKATRSEAEVRAETRRSVPEVRIARQALSVDPSRMTGMLAAVQERSDDLDRREVSLAERETALAALERTLDGALAQLEGRDGPTPTAGGEGCRLEGGVTRIYETMRPDQAAAILERMDDETLRVIFGKMDAVQVGAIVAEMSRERAVAFTQLLARDQVAVDVSSYATR